MVENDDTIMVRVPRHLKHQLKQLADADRERPMANLVRAVLVEFVEREQRGGDQQAA
jgi:predicted transcriptional regulator